MIPEILFYSRRNNLVHFSLAFFSSYEPTSEEGNQMLCLHLEGKGSVSFLHLILLISYQVKL